MPGAPRPGEQGLSLVEVLVVLAITSLIAAIVLSTTSRGVRDNFGLAERGLRSAEHAAAEESFRRLVRAAVPPQPSGTSVGGAAALVGFAAEVDEATACAPKGRRSVVLLRLVPDGRGGRLLCEGDERTTELARWPSGSARFSYSLDAARWSDRWPEGGRLDRPANVAPEAPLVRLLVVARGRPQLLWIERAGQAAPADPVAGLAGTRS